MLQRAIYVSDAVGNAGASILSLAQILGVSDRNNRRDHVTGVLLVHQGQFLQVIEGARADIDRLLARLGRDPRHKAMRMLANAAVETRRFGSWALGQCTLTPEAEEVLRGRPLSDLTAPEAEAILMCGCAPLDLSA